MKKIALYTIAVLFVLAACEKKSEFIEEIEIGCDLPVAEVSSDAGSHSFQVIAGGNVTASLPSDASWVRFSGSGSKTMSFSGDMTIAMDYDANEGEERSAKINLVSGHRKLVLELMQDGVQDRDFYFPQRNVLIGFEGAAHSIPFSYAVEEESIEYEVIYEQGRDWIEEPVAGVHDSLLMFAAKENLGAERRAAVIRLSSVDKVGRPLEARLFVSQQTRSEVETIPVTLWDVREMSAQNNDMDAESKIRKNYVLTARVVSDNAEGNGGANRNLSIITQDLTQSARTVYLQSLAPDASGQYCGAQLQFESEVDNSCKRYDILEINLRGVKLEHKGDGGKVPEHIVLSGAKAVNIVSSTLGSKDDLPVIERSIKDLTDLDIYTYVTLKDCEIPIRKGPYVPVDLRYTNIINKYPMPLRDADGSTMFLVTNTTAAWARDGEGLPQGGGDVSGIIVHERCDNMEWDPVEAAASPLLSDYITDIGYIGRYQIRPLTKAEIGITNDLEDAPSRIISEWRYFNRSFPQRYICNVDASGKIYPTWPAVSDPLTSPDVNGTIIYSNYPATPMNPCFDWSHLGPMVDGRITDVPGGNGVTDANGTSIHWHHHSNIAGIGVIYDNSGSAWLGGNWFSGDHNNPKLQNYYWQIDLSTEDYDASAAPLSVQLGVHNGYGSDYGAPRYWTLAWSTDGSSWNELNGDSYDGEQYKMWIRTDSEWTYTVPDVPKPETKRQWHLAGDKYISLNLPAAADIWGKEHLYIRLYPAADKSGDDAAQAVSYDGAGIRNSRRSCLNYVGIRCKK